MAQDMTHEELLRGVLDRVVENNRSLRPGTPMAELKDAIEASLSSLPPLEFKEFSQVTEGDANYAAELLRRAPELLGWDADQIIAWVEEVTEKLES
jgi:hypothetical protein